MDDKSRRVVEYVRNGLLDGRLIAGDKLGMADLSERLGVSTAPVRDGLLRLTERRLVLGGKGSRFYICDYDRTLQLRALDVAWVHHRQALQTLAAGAENRKTMQVLVDNAALDHPETANRAVYDLIKALTESASDILVFLHFSIALDLAIVPPVPLLPAMGSTVGQHYKKVLVQLQDGDMKGAEQSLAALYHLMRRVISDAHAMKLVYRKNLRTGDGTAF